MAECAPHFSPFMNKDFSVNKLVLIIIAILLAPLAVFLKKGVGKDLIINVLLCFLLYVPAVIHALWVSTK